jgi:hypothetical protein
MWIDLMFPVRAVYFPLQQKPSKDYPDLCTYLMVDFRLRKGVKIMDQPQFHMGDSNKTPVCHNVPFDNQTGLGMQPHKTIGLDIPGIYNYLILPRQMRSAEKGLYQPSDPADALIRLTGPAVTSVPASREKNSSNEGFIQRPWTNKLDFAHVVSEQFGVHLDYVPFEMPPDEQTSMDEVRGILTMAITVGLGFIPYAGPLLQRGFMIVQAIIEDPEGFKKRDPLELGLSIADGIAESALQIRGNMSIIGKGSAKGLGKRQGAPSETALKMINFVSKTVLRDEPEIGTDPNEKGKK